MRGIETEKCDVTFFGSYGTFVIFLYCLRKNTSNAYHAFILFHCLLLWAVMGSLIHQPNEAVMHAMANQCDGSLHAHMQAGSKDAFKKIYKLNVRYVRYLRFRIGYMIYIYICHICHFFTNKINQTTFITFILVVWIVMSWLSGYICERCESILLYSFFIFVTFVKFCEFLWKLLVPVLGMAGFFQLVKCFYRNAMKWVFLDASVAEQSHQSHCAMI